METHCLLCRTPRGPDVRRCSCGYVYDPPPPEGALPSGHPDEVWDTMPRYRTSGIVETLLLLFITGTNPTGVCVVLVGVMAAGIVGTVFALPTSGYWCVFGATAFGFDLVARRMLKCGVGDVKRGSQFFQFPVWILALFVTLFAVMLLTIP